MNCNKNFLLDKRIACICRNEYKCFLNKKGVVAVALGYKITKGFSTFKKCITVFVEKKLSLKNLSKQNIIPICYKGIITDVIESGNFKTNSLTTRVRPVINGYSIGNIEGDASGTCACLVYDRYLYILSCNHVLAISNQAPIESVIIQPGVDDGGTIKKDVVGHLKRFVPIKFIQGTQEPENFADCALCKVINKSFVSSQIAFIGTPKGSAKPILNEDVQKVGKITELTRGKVTNLYGTVKLNFAATGKKALFKNQIFTTKMSSLGDSGSLLLNSNIYALGLLMGGNPQRDIFNSIDYVLKELKVQLVTS